MRVLKARYQRLGCWAHRWDGTCAGEVADGPTFEGRPERRDIVDCDLVHPVAEEIPHTELLVLAYARVLSGGYQRGHLGL